MGKRIKFRRVLGLTRYQFLLWVLDSKTLAVNFVLMLCMLAAGLELRNVLLQHARSISVWELWPLMMSEASTRLILCTGFFLNTLDGFIPGRGQYFALQRSGKGDYLAAIILNCIIKSILYFCFMFLGLILVFVKAESVSWTWSQGMKLFCYSDSLSLGLRMTVNIRDTMLLTETPLSALWMQAGLVILGTVCFSFLCASMQMLLGKAAVWLPVAAAFVLEEGIRGSLISSGWKHISYFHLIDGREVFWAGRFSDLSPISSIGFMSLMGISGMVLYAVCFWKRDLS